ncbi:Peroxisomal membrane signal receptor PTS1 [Cyanidiococcus yangmingshanensis]|uniref:Peroxisomal membrane signal receptor PTS1 n=1 Tax=Cyanidiococcus yangmingshanensis TaxID=2690220 RepID=A0A7J7IHB1_9RHOD|nr:Peroxisomal membrane signal receptor PTS1 [Cyanidiococcus yangmingshanensis]
MASSWRPSAAPSNVCVPDDVSGASSGAYAGGVGGVAPDGASSWLNQLDAAAGVRERSWAPSTGRGPVFTAPRPGEEAVELPLPPALAAELAARGAPIQGAPSSAPALMADFARMQLQGPPPGMRVGPLAQAPPDLLSPMATAWNASARGPVPQQVWASTAAPALEHVWANAASTGAMHRAGPAMHPSTWTAPYRSAYMPRYTSFYGPPAYHAAMQHTNNVAEAKHTQPMETARQSASAQEHAIEEQPQQRVSAGAHVQAGIERPAAANETSSTSANRSGLSFEELLRRAQIDIDDTFDDDYLHTYGREIRETAYRFQYEPAENRYLSIETHDPQSTSDRAAALAALAEGERLYAEGQLAEAIMAFEAAVKLDRELSRAWYFLGVSHAESDQDPQAIASLKRALECNGDEAQGDDVIADALLCLGVSYTNELNPNQALRYLERWLDLHPLARHHRTGSEATATALPSSLEPESDLRASQVDELLAQQRSLLSRVQNLLAQSKEAQAMQTSTQCSASSIRSCAITMLRFWRSVVL